MEPSREPSLTEVFHAAIDSMWEGRKTQALRGAGKDRGTRSEVTGGLHLNGLEDACTILLQRCGIPLEAISNKMAIPGYTSVTKNWDVVGLPEKKTVLCELRSMVGSVGKNFNNRAQEALAAGIDVRWAWEHGLFEGREAPFRLHCFVLGEDAETRRRLRPVKHGLLSTAPARPQEIASGEAQTYTDRFAQSFSRMVEKGAYDAVIFLAADKTTGNFREPLAGIGIDVAEQRLRAYLGSE